jgi:NitT/TauT family transport system ATP-binding protein
MAISLKSVTKMFPSKEFGRPLLVLDNIDLEVLKGKVVALYGPNGCGKTTILNIVSRIETPDSGVVSVNGDGQHSPLVGYAFQNFRDVLLPWESALDNVSFGLRALGVSRASARERTVSFLEKHSFAFPRDNYPYQLSIGQQQTVALARTLIQEPANALLDEPFAALDHKARFRMQDFVESVVRTNSTSILFVSHDVDEALYVSDELVLLSKLPAKVIMRFSVPFERPRRRELLTSAEFAALRREVITSFLKEVER